MKRSTLWVCGVIATAAYLAAALYLQQTYQDPRPTGRRVRILQPPFDDLGGNFFVKYAVEAGPDVVVYEDREPLDPYIAEKRGPGQFDIQPNGVIFSPTDGTHPNEGRHRYWLVTK